MIHLKSFKEGLNNGLMINEITDMFQELVDNYSLNPNHIEAESTREISDIYYVIQNVKGTKYDEVAITIWYGENNKSTYKEMLPDLMNILKRISESGYIINSNENIETYKGCYYKQLEATRLYLKNPLIIWIREN